MSISVQEIANDCFAGLFRTWHVPCLIWVRSFVMRHRITLSEATKPRYINECR